LIGGNQTHFLQADRCFLRKNISPGTSTSAGAVADNLSIVQAIMRGSLADLILSSGSVSDEWLFF